MWLFTKDAAYAIVRTVVTFAYGWIATNIPAVADILDTVGLSEGTAVLIIGGVVYTVVRQTAERWSWVGYLLVFNENPTYNNT